MTPDAPEVVKVDCGFDVTTKVVVEQKLEIEFDARR